MGLDQWWKLSPATVKAQSEPDLGSKSIPAPAKRKSLVILFRLRDAKLGYAVTSAFGKPPLIKVPSYQDKKHIAFQYEARQKAGGWKGPIHSGGFCPTIYSIHLSGPSTSMQLKEATLEEASLAPTLAMRDT